MKTWTKRKMRIVLVLFSILVYLCHKKRAFCGKIHIGCRDARVQWKLVRLFKQFSRPVRMIFLFFYFHTFSIIFSNSSQLNEIWCEKNWVRQNYFSPLSMDCSITSVLVSLNLNGSDSLPILCEKITNKQGQQLALKLIYN